MKMDSWTYTKIYNHLKTLTQIQPAYIYRPTVNL